MPHVEGVDTTPQSSSVYDQCSSLHWASLWCVPYLSCQAAELQKQAKNRAKNFGLITSSKKTEGLYRPPPREAYSPPHISIDGTNLNAVEHFTYLGSVISNDASHQES